LHVWDGMQACAGGIWFMAVEEKSKSKPIISKHMIRMPRLIQQLGPEITAIAPRSLELDPGIVSIAPRSYHCPAVSGIGVRNCCHWFPELIQYIFYLITEYI
jgi:hypothetical protein